MMATRGTAITIAVALLLLVYFERTNGRHNIMLENCSASECTMCNVASASCDVDLVEEDGIIFQYIINCTAPPECKPMPVYPDPPNYCVVSVRPVGDAEGDWSYQASNIQFASYHGHTCEDWERDGGLTPDCTALSNNCSTSTLATDPTKCFSIICRCYNDDCGASIYATVTIFNNTDTIDTTTTSTIPPSPTYTASTTPTHAPTITSVSPSPIYTSLAQTTVLNTSSSSTMIPYTTSTGSSSPGQTISTIIDASSSANPPTNAGTLDDSNIGMSVCVCVRVRVCVCVCVCVCVRACARGMKLQKNRVQDSES